jgi:hypothetical protein
MIGGWGSVNNNSVPDGNGHEDSRLMLFATERIEDYTVLSLALAILILILVFH